jgi:hypothetical protein
MLQEEGDQKEDSQEVFGKLILVCVRETLPRSRALLPENHQVWVFGSGRALREAIPAYLIFVQSNHNCFLPRQGSSPFPNTGEVSIA